MALARLAPVAVLAAFLSARSLQAAQLIIVGNTPGTFMNIAPVNQGGDGTGAALNLSIVNPIAFRTVTTITNDLGISPGSQLVINNRGGIKFSAGGTNIMPTPNASIASHTAFGGGPSFIPLWDEIDTVGDVYYNERSNDRIIVQWQQKGFEGAPASQTTTFEVQIFNRPPFRGPDVFAQYLYADVNGARADHGSGATIGYQDGSLTHNDFEWSFNLPLAVSDGSVLTLIPEPATALLLLAGGMTLMRRR